jgi:hypothetical protein
MPSHGEVAEFVRVAIYGDKHATDAVRGAVLLRQLQSGGDSRVAGLAFDLWLEGR